MITIIKLSDLPNASFTVTVKGEVETNHTVSLSQEYYDHLTAGAVSPEELIKASFEFLLERESNTSILSQFSLNQILAYFPEYETQIKKHF